MQKAEVGLLQHLAQGVVFLAGEGVKPVQVKLTGPLFRSLEKGKKVLLPVGQGSLEGRSIPKGIKAHVPRHLPVPQEDQAVLQLLGQALEVPGLRGQDPPLGAFVHPAEEL
ncbi:hypothetical protein HRbin38_00456 [bacterium HR38]|nr:hypothetical protein HRbin38_00456 [bacterium HR38]